MSRPYGHIMMSDVARFPDWRRHISAMARGNGVILRDYDHPQRALLAAEMAKLCRQQGRGFWVAGDAALARRLSVGFHCPSYLLPRQPQFTAAPHLPATAAVHNMRQIQQAAQAGFQLLLLSPAFETSSHVGASAWGPVRFIQLARSAEKYGLQIYALGGMNDKNWRRLAGGHDVISAYAAISAFQTHEAPA